MGRTGHSGPFALAQFDEPLGLGRAQGLPKAVAANLELGRKLPLRGQFAAFEFMKLAGGGKIITVSSNVGKGAGKNKIRPDFIVFR